MKRILCLLLCLCMLPVLCAAESDAPAREISVQLLEGRMALDMAALADGNDETAHAYKRGKSVTLAGEMPEDETVTQIYLRMKTAPEKLTLRVKEDKRWVDALVVNQPGAEAVIAYPAGVKGPMQLLLDFAAPVSAEVTELRFFTDGTLPEKLHVWQRTGECDMLLVAEGEEQLDADAVAQWVQAGRSVACLLLTAPEDMLKLYDRLWEAGVRRTPAVLGLAAQPGVTDTAKLDKAWADKFFLYPLVSGIRAAAPMAVTVNGSGEHAEYLMDKVKQAADNAKEATFQTADAEQNGIWIVENLLMMEDKAGIDTLLANWEERSDKALRAFCQRQYEGAQHADPATIPYPENRLADGYLGEGEFVFEDAENGLWAYLSPTMQVEIVRYELPEKPQVWFVTDLKFKPESEALAQVVYANASFKNQQIYPETLAQTSKIVLAVNGDYYPYRVERKTAVGNILRNREVLYNYDAKKRLAYPNLDTMALRDDGTLSVYRGSEITATELLEQGDVHDALSFGPYLARNGKIRIYSGEGYDATEPRNAVGMIEAGHYCIITVEGRINPGPKGVTLNVLAEMMYAQGVTDAFNLDGGSTSVLIFMGEKLNRTGANSGHGVGSPRNMHELFGIGTSEQVHTDKLNKK